MYRFSLFAAFIAMLVQPSLADDFRVIDDRSSFVRLVEGRELTRFGIKLDVRQSGQIAGSAFGRAVTGVWSWENGYFCRDLNFGAQNLGPNCQVVKVSGTTLRFIADRGQGDTADLKLR